MEGSELLADIHRRWAMLDGKILRASFDVGTTVIITTIIIGVCVSFKFCSGGAASIRTVYYRYLALVFVISHCYHHNH